MCTLDFRTFTSLPGDLAWWLFRGRENKRTVKNAKSIPAATIKSQQGAGQVKPVIQHLDLQIAGSLLNWKCPEERVCGKQHWRGGAGVLQLWVSRVVDFVFWIDSYLTGHGPSLDLVMGYVSAADRGLATTPRWSAQRCKSKGPVWSPGRCRLRLESFFPLPELEDLFWLHLSVQVQAFSQILWDAIFALTCEELVLPTKLPRWGPRTKLFAPWRFLHCQTLPSQILIFGNDFYRWMWGDVRRTVFGFSMAHCRVQLIHYNTLL